MNKIKHVAMLFALLFSSTTGVFAQFAIQKALRYDNLSERWSDYQQETKYGLLNFSRRYFKDTISVAEMKEAFFKYKDVKFTKSPYAGLDSVKRIGTIGESVMILSPLRNHPKKEIRDCRGVWNRLGSFSLVDL